MKLEDMEIENEELLSLFFAAAAVQGMTGDQFLAKLLLDWQMASGTPDLIHLRMVAEKIAGGK